MEHGVKPHSKHLTEYFAFLYEFAKMGEEEVRLIFSLSFFLYSQENQAASINKLPWPLS